MGIYPLDVLKKAGARKSAYERMLIARNIAWMDGSERSRINSRLAEIEWGEAFEEHRRALADQRTKDCLESASF